MEPSTSAHLTSPPRRSSFQRLTARFTVRRNTTSTSTSTTTEPEPEPEPEPVAPTIPEDPARAESLAQLKKELMMLNDKERARMAEARADRVRVREAVEQFRELAAEAGCGGIAGLGVVGELGE